jgi:hypothetical protein
MHAALSRSLLTRPLMPLNSIILRRSAATSLLASSAPSQIRSGWCQTASSERQQLRSISAGAMSQHKRRRPADGPAGAFPSETSNQDHIEDDPNYAISQVAAALKGISTVNQPMHNSTGSQAPGYRQGASPGTRCEDPRLQFSAVHWRVYVYNDGDGMPARPYISYTGHLRYLRPCHRCDSCPSQRWHVHAPSAETAPAAAPLQTFHDNILHRLWHPRCSARAQQRIPCRAARQAVAAIKRCQGQLQR